MNCPKADKLSQYVDNLLTERENMEIQTHLTSCTNCNHVVEAFQKEQEFLKGTLQTPTLPDDFTCTVLEQLEPYEQKGLRRWSKRWKHILITAAGIVLAFGLTATFSPSFAQLIGGMFGTEQVDEGLRMASESGLVECVNLEVTDKEITFKVEDVIVDSSRVALSFQVLNKDGKPQDTQLNINHSQNEIIATDQNGNELPMGGGWWEGSDYGLTEVSLRGREGLEKITVKFDLVELNGVKGNWKLEVPVDLTEMNKLTTTVPLNEKISSHGAEINLEKFQFAPTSNEFFYETSFTKEEYAKVEEEVQRLEEKLGDTSEYAFTNYGTAIQYHIENEDKKIVYQDNHSFNGEFSGVGQRQSSSQETETFGKVVRNDSFIPLKDEGKLTFVLDGVYKTVPSNFSIKIKPKELKNNPVSFEYEGNFITIKSAEIESEFSLRKSLFPVQKEEVFTIVMEGGKEVNASALGVWALVDEKGRTYETLPGGSIFTEKDKNNRYKLNMKLNTYDLHEVPEELTLHLLSVTRFEEVEDKWKVQLYK